MARIKLIIGNEERDILRFSTDYFEPAPNDPAWGDPKWDSLADDLLKGMNKESPFVSSWEKSSLASRLRNGSTYSWDWDDILRPREDNYWDRRDILEKLRTLKPPNSNPSLKEFNKHKRVGAYRPPRNPFGGKCCPFGGLLNLTMESTDNDDFFLHAFKDEKWFNGRIEVYNAFDDDLPFKRFEFWDACIIEISEHFKAYSGMPMLLRMEISPATVRVNKAVVFQKSWYETDINAPIPIYQSAEEDEEEDKNITKMYWVDADTKERIEEIADNQKIRLCIETEGYKKGETAKVKVEWTDGELFDGNAMSRTFSGVVDEYGKAISDEVLENK